jgi:asparagine N-glycosylation enzyme membrane subunit Stt3
MRFSPNLNVSLWILQALLAVFFALGSGAPKLLLSVEQLPMPIQLPSAFIKSIGVAEVLGALGLLLPGLFHVRPGLTPLAAACLVALTVCAAVYQLLARQPESAIFALVIGLLCALVAIGRSRGAPHRARGRTDVGAGAALA